MRHAGWQKYRWSFPFWKRQRWWLQSNRYLSFKYVMGYRNEYTDSSDAAGATLLFLPLCCPCGTWIMRSTHGYRSIPDTVGSPRRSFLLFPHSNLYGG